MNRNLACASAILALAVLASRSDAAVLYSQNFDTPSPVTDKTFSDYGWAAHRGSDGARLGGGTWTQSASTDGRVVFDAAAPSPSGRAFLYFNPSSNDVLTWTNNGGALSVNTASYSNLAINWYERNGAVATTGIRAAVAVFNGSTTIWYASDLKNDTAAWTSQSVSLASSVWVPFTFTGTQTTNAAAFDVAGAAGALGAGTIVAVGLYSQVPTNSAIRFDSFSLSGDALVTPTTYTLTTAGTSNLLKGGSASLNTTLTNTGGASPSTADSLTYSGVGATLSSGVGSVSAGTPISGSGLANGSSVSNTSQTYSASAYGTATIDSVGTITSPSTTPTGTPTGTVINVGNAAVGVTNGTFGTALTAPVAISAAYDGLASRTTAGVNSALGNEAIIVKGNNDAVDADTVSMAWRTRTALETFPNSPPVLSDVVRILNVDGLYVLTIAYKASDVPLAINESSLALGWLNNSSIWVNAVAGNSGGTALRINGDWSTAVGTLDLNDLGKYGVYTTDFTSDSVNYGGYVWAVLDHNSDFAVIPEPASLGLLAIGGLALAARRRRSN